MKYIVTVYLLAIIFIIQGEADETSKLNAILKQCKEENEASKNFQEQYMNGVMQDNRADMCAAACVQIKLGVRYSNNSVNVTQYKNTLKHFKLSDEVINEMVQNCTIPEMPDKCDSAGFLYNCTLDIYKKRSKATIAFKKCSEKHNAPADLEKSLAILQLPNDRNSLCTMACINSELDVVSPTNVVNKENFVKTLTASKVDETKANTIVDTCVKSIEGVSDNCEVAGILYNCTVSYFKQ